MEKLNARIREIAAKENEHARRLAEAAEKAGKLLKAVAAEEESILAAAASEAAAEKEKLLAAAARRAEEEVSRMLVNAEVEAKKRAVVFREKSGDMISSLFKDLEGYLNN